MTTNYLSKHADSMFPPHEYPRRELFNMLSMGAQEFFLISTLENRQENHL